LLLQVVAVAGDGLVVEAILVEATEVAARGAEWDVDIQQTFVSWQGVLA
ncbi:hypothetical protein EDWATA_01973, partial [Edwardsiella tarda ATCC 23685]